MKDLGFQVAHRLHVFKINFNGTILEVSADLAESASSLRYDPLAHSFWTFQGKESSTLTAHEFDALRNLEIPVFEELFTV